MRCQFQRVVEQFFKDSGRIVAKWPLLFIIISCAIAVSLTVGLALNARHVDARYDNDDRLRAFLPENAESIKRLHQLQNLFPFSKNRDVYDAFRGAYAYAIFTSPLHENILRDDVLRIVNEVVEKVKRIRVTVSWLDAAWEQLCMKSAQNEHTCFEHPIVSFLSSANSKALMQQFSLAHQLFTYPTMKLNGRILDNTLVLGSVKRTADTGEILEAKALRVPFILQNAGNSLERRILNELWQNEFIQLMQKLPSYAPNVTVDFSTSVSWLHEMDRNGGMLTSYLPALFAVLVIFSVFCCCTTDCVKSQPWLGFCGVLSAVFAVLSSFGILFFFKYEYLQMVVIMPFLILSVSADNAFLMLAAWRKAGETTQDVEKRISISVSEAAVSILITALTDGLSFTVGSASQFPAVRIFCTYCALAILCTFVYQVTFFAACLTLCGRREAANRHCVTLKTRSAIEPNKQDTRRATKNLLSYANNGLAKKFSNVLSSALSNSTVKFFVVIFYSFYLAINIWGLVHLDLNLNLSNLVPYDSYVSREQAAVEEHFSEYGGYAQAVVLTNDTATLHQVETLEKLTRLYSSLIDTDYTSKGEFWLDDFIDYAERKPDLTSTAFASYNSFVVAVKKFVQEPGNDAYRDDVAWTPDGSRIATVRMFVRLRGVSRANHSAAASTLRKRFAESGLKGFVVDPVVFVLADQSDAVLGCVLQDAAVAAAVIIFIAFVFIPKLLCAVWIGLSIISINAGVLGFLALWDVHLDVVSMMTTVMSVGLSVDYVAHVTYHYLITRHPDSNVRLRTALEHAGWSSLQSAAATILGASTLAFVDSYVVRTFVKTVLLVVVLGLSHGLIFLPVALSVFVPADQYLETLGNENYGRVRQYVAGTFSHFDYKGRLAGYRSQSAVVQTLGSQHVASQPNEQVQKNQVVACVQSDNCTGLYGFLKAKKTRPARGARLKIFACGESKHSTTATATSSDYTTPTCSSTATDTTATSSSTSYDSGPSEVSILPFLVPSDHPKMHEKFASVQHIRSVMPPTICEESEYVNSTQTSSMSNEETRKNTMHKTQNNASDSPIYYSPPSEISQKAVAVGRRGKPQVDSRTVNLGFVNRELLVSRLFEKARREQDGAGEIVQIFLKNRTNAPPARNNTTQVLQTEKHEPQSQHVAKREDNCEGLQTFQCVLHEKL